MLSLLTLNLGAPALARARLQLPWLAAREEDVLVLTEPSAGEGSAYLAERFSSAGYTVTFPEHAPGERGVMLVSKLATTIDALGAALDYLPTRAAAVVVETTNGPLRIAGAYVPSRDATAVKTEQKQRWIAAFDDALTRTASEAPLLLGDLNVIEPGHEPAHRSQFAPFEYDFYAGLTARHGLVDLFRHKHPDRVEHSWARQTHYGYRYDHAYGSPTLAQRLLKCVYDHSTRQEIVERPALTDHSGLSVHLELTATAPLLPSDPVTAAGQADAEMTLF
ncbi:MULTISPECIES: endonuclease/exonuclease/phosphatase family protein [unclassified Crossiella]|uniref:endonuclease/exonuclease/phosphatase family protein n=1 Tax=unclassified Crossiella TaxID=2620835 RepID=UPI001FFF1B3F|nr:MULTISPECIES: endonuclease/exonuclease/phosphatase family protein [unclassified Crossiella]MCK2241896.1 hypothetical protein [Crossiella sp. S99.2]MCK2255799.1 hypothetical protein [Crossiella sp. S99.1]